MSGFVFANPEMGMMATGSCLGQRGSPQGGLQPPTPSGWLHCSLPQGPLHLVIGTLTKPFVEMVGGILWIVTAIAASATPLKKEYSGSSFPGCGVVRTTGLNSWHACFLTLSAWVDFTTLKMC